MRNPPCVAPLGTQQLLAYWLDELDEREAETTEQHVFGCAECSAALERIVALAEGTRKLLGQGEIASVLSPSFVQRMKAAGLRIREYRLQPHTSVNCTVTPEDDLVLAHLHASLEDVKRLDAIVEYVEAGVKTRLVDLSFNASDGEVVFLPRTSDLRPIQRATQRVRLVSADENGERTLGVYTFNHRAASQ
jgi:hypothetical protein